MTREIWKRTNLRTCPYCGGELVRSKTGMYLYDCIQCERGWDVDMQGNFHSKFDASRCVFSKHGVRIQ